MWAIVFIVDVQAWGWPSTIWLAAQAVETGVRLVFGACGWPSEIVETIAAEVGACGCPLANC
jgi:hypothetical protein